MHPLAREIHLHQEGPQPGPEVYSLQAAKIALEIASKGPQRQSTVSMDLSKGERISTFLWDKQMSDYDQKYHD